MKNPTLEIYNILDQMFDLPNNIQSLSLHLSMEKPPILEVTYIADFIDKSNIVTKHFKIDEID